MKLTEISQRLKDQGINLPDHTIRRRIDVYLSHPSRGRLTNNRDLKPSEYDRLSIALGLELKGIAEDDIKDYLNGKMSKIGLTGKLIDSNKVDAMLLQWINI